MGCGCQGIFGAGDPAPESCDGGKLAPALHVRRPGALPPSSAAGALLAVPAAPRAACKMSVRRGQRTAGPGTHLSWLLCCSALLSPAAGYVIVSSVSWAVTNEVDEELDSASTEEAMPALLEDSGSIWQRSFPASAHKEDAHLPSPAGTARARPSPAPPGMFSYRRESGRRLRPSTARFLAHASAWGCLATVSVHEKVSHPGGSLWQVSASQWPGTQMERPGDRKMLLTTHVLGSRANRCAQWARLALEHPINNGTRLCFGSPGNMGLEGRRGPDSQASCQVVGDRRVVWRCLVVETHK